MVTQQNAAAICKHLTLTPQVLALLQEDMPARVYAQTLSDQKFYVPGIDFVAHALPTVETIWWACLCFQHACGENISLTDKQACLAAVQWLFEPTEQLRLAARQPAELAGRSSPASALAAAVYSTGPNPDHGKAAQTDSFAAAKAAANSIKLSCTKVGAVKMIETQRLFLQLGMSRVAG